MSIIRGIFEQISVLIVTRMYFFLTYHCRMETVKVKLDTNALGDDPIPKLLKAKEAKERNRSNKRAGA